MTHVTRRTRTTRRTPPKSTVTEPKKISDKKILRTKNVFWTQNSFWIEIFLNQQFFWTKIFFSDPTFCSDPKFFWPKMNFNENDFWRDNTEFLNLRLSKLPSTKVLLKVEFDTEDQVLFFNLMRTINFSIQSQLSLVWLFFIMFDIQSLIKFLQFSMARFQLI